MADTLPAMPADIDPTADPNAKGRCPRRLLNKGGARCLSLVLARDADEHEQWHDDLDDLLERALGAEVPAEGTVPWPVNADDVEAAGGSL